MREILQYAAEVAKRLRARLARAFGNPERNHRLVVAYCVGLILAYAFIAAGRLQPGFPLGGPGDFTIFYTAARILSSGQAHRLYDLGLQTEVQQALLAPHGFGFVDGLMPYNYPPFFALVFIPLGSLPLGWAFPLWNLVSVVLILASTKLLLRHQGRHSGRDLMLACLVVFAFFPVFVALMRGQSSPLVLFALALTYLALKSNRDYLAGLALALGLVKPQLILVFVAVLLYRRRWRTVSSFSAATLLLLLVSYLVVGLDGLLSYLDLIRQMSTWQGVYGFYPMAMSNLRGTVYRLAALTQAWFGTEWSPHLIAAITVLLSLLVLGWLLYIWRGRWRPARPEFELQFGLTVLAALLISPHLYGQDLIVLVLVGFLLLYFYGYYARSATAHRMIAIGHVAILMPAYAIGLAGRAQAIAILLVGFMLVMYRELGLAVHRRG